MEENKALAQLAFDAEEYARKCALLLAGIRPMEFAEKMEDRIDAAMANCAWAIGTLGIVQKKIRAML